MLDYSLLLGVYKQTEEEMKQPNNPITKIGIGKALTPFWAMEFDGMRGVDDYVQPTPYLYFVGIIDFLTPFNITKKAENFLKSLIHEKNTMSVIPPEKYAERFSTYLKSIVR